MAPLQQMLQILQQAQGAGAAPGAAPPGAAPAGGGPMDDSAPPGMEDDDGDDQYGDDASPPGGDGGGGDPMAGGDDDGMGGGASLHDRVSKLEGHTGLKKSASSPVGLLDRVTELEEVLLGTEYEGPLGDRIGQLEKAAGVSTPKPAAVAEPDEAPDEIPLDALIKSAIQAGIKEGMSAIAKTMPQQGDDDLPNPATMRKAAANGNHYGQRRAAPQAIAGDADLVKAAQNMGYTDEDLDAPASFGDLLMYQYYVGQGGQMLHSGDDGDDDD
jgi:hypothetical protein